MRSNAANAGVAVATKLPADRRPRPAETDIFYQRRVECIDAEPVVEKTALLTTARACERRPRERTRPLVVGLLADHERKKIAARLRFDDREIRDDIGALHASDVDDLPVIEYGVFFGEPALARQIRG